MTLVLLLNDAGAAPAPVPPITDLQVYGLPGAVYGVTPNRAPSTLIVCDPAVLTWTGQALDAPLTLAIDPMDLRWVGRNIPEVFSITDLQVYGLPGPPMGPFPPRAPSTTIIIDPLSLAWVGQDVIAPGDEMSPATLTWTGQSVVVLEHAAITDLGPTGFWPGPSWEPIPRKDGYTGTAVGSFTWTGQEVVIATVVTCEPMVLTWTGQAVTHPRAPRRTRGLRPLTGVS